MKSARNLQHQENRSGLVSRILRLRLGHRLHPEVEIDFQLYAQDTLSRGIYPENASDNFDIP